MRAPLLILPFAIGLVACGGGAVGPASARGTLASHESARLDDATIERADDTRAIADIEVSVSPDVSREDLVREALRRIGAVERAGDRGCAVGPRLARMRSLAESLETAPDPWNDYALVVTIERRALAECE